MQREDINGGLVLWSNEVKVALLRHAKVYVHGLGNTSAVWHTMMQHDKDHGVRAFALDLPGHGVSKQDEVYFSHNTLGDYVHSVFASITFIVEEEEIQLSNLTVIGHSMGALLARRAVQSLRSSPAGLIQIAPALPRGMVPMRIRALPVLMRHIHQILWGDVVTLNKNEVNKFMAHDLSDDDFSALIAATGYEASSVVRELLLPQKVLHTQWRKAPSLVVVPRQDQLIPPGGQLKLARCMMAKRRICDGSHFNPLYNLQTMEDIHDWWIKNVVQK